MDFYQILANNNMQDLLQDVEYEAPSFENLGATLQILQEIVNNNASTFIICDYDVDGLMCNLVLYNGLRMCKCTNLHRFEYRSRTHALDPVAIQQCISGRYRYCIIADCGSSDLDLLNQLSSYGVKTILLDHHDCQSDYSDFKKIKNLTVINTTLENQVFELSAGALCYCVMCQLLQNNNIYEAGLSVYGLISLYADCMDMHDRLNRAIYYKAVKVPQVEIPNEVAIFMNQYQRISARFINFWFSPRINAMFRSNNLNVLNRLFLTESPLVMEVQSCLEEIEAKYTENRELVAKVADIIDVTELDNMIIADIGSVDKHISVKDNLLWNYTGLIANKLSERYSKMAFVYCYHNNEIKASVRDIFGRDFLSLFVRLCNAGGHKPAFGMTIKVFDLKQMLRKLKQIDKKLTLENVSNEPIVIKYKFLAPDAALIEDIARVNEFAGTNVPVILLQKQLVGAIEERKTAYNYKYKWGDFDIQSQHPISFGSWMFLKPIVSLHTKLLVQ